MNRIGKYFKNPMKTLSIILIIAATAVVFTGKTIAGHRKLINVDGSSTVFPITEAVAEEFQIGHKDIMVTVGISGTGGGFKKFGRGETDISNASRPIKTSEADLCVQNGIEYIELPVAYDGLAVMVNPKNDWVDYLTVKELKKLWEPEAQKTVTKWNQIRPEWPDKEIHLYGPGVDSGTFDYFTEAINGKSGASRGDFTASEDDNVLVQGIATDKYALGFFGLAYYEHNKDKLRLVSIDDEKDDNGKGGILPSMETVNNGTYQPLARPIFIYVGKKAADKPEIDEFVKYYINNAGTLSAEVGYIPLPEEAYRIVFSRFENRVTGSVFFGAKTGVKIEDLLGL